MSSNNNKKKRLVALTGMAATGLLVASIAGLGAAQPSYEQLAIRRGFITSWMIQDNSIVSDDLKDGAAVRSSDIVDGQVNTADLANGAVTSDKIRNGEVTSEDVADGSITSTDLAPDTIPPGGGIPDDNSVTSAKIVDGEVKSADIGDGEVKAEDLDPSIELGGGGGTSNFNLQVTERSNSREAPNQGFGDFITVSVQCNSDEVVTGGGFEKSKQYGDALPSEEVLVSKRQDNGWTVTVFKHDDDSTVRVYAECLKIVPAAAE